MILAANRDEFYSRPTAQADFWKDYPEILGGRDLQAGGSWMTISRSGKFSAVTNYRDPLNIKPDALSRGEIPVNYLTGQQSPEKYINTLHSSLDKYNGFNVLVGDHVTMAHYSNYERKLNVMERGIYGLSNALLDTDWPKVQRAKSLFRDVVARSFEHADLIEMMSNTETADDAILPDTGVSPEWEKALSAMCIRTENYGTCSTTVITVDRLGKVAFTEKTHLLEHPDGNYPSDNNVVHFEFDIEQ